MALAGLSLVCCIVAFLKGDDKTQEYVWAAFSKAFVPIALLDFGFTAQGTARALTTWGGIIVGLLP
jgi:hypothetical protein